MVVLLLCKLTVPIVCLVQPLFKMIFSPSCMKGDTHPFLPKIAFLNPDRAIVRVLAEERLGLPCWMSFSCGDGERVSHGEHFAAEVLPVCLQACVHTFFQVILQTTEQSGEDYQLYTIPCGMLSLPGSSLFFPSIICELDYTSGLSVGVSSCGLRVCVPIESAALTGANNSCVWHRNS